MSYSQWAASLHIPHLQANAAAAAASGTVQPASASLSLQYECSCGRLHPHLAFLYWCRHCQAMQCASCTTQQVDTYFCPACLNSVFTTPAFANQNRSEDVRTGGRPGLGAQRLKFHPEQGVNGSRS